MLHHNTSNPLWFAAASAAMVGADPAQRVAQHVEGPTLIERELPFNRGLASVDRAPTCNCRSSRAYAGAGPGRLMRRAAASLRTSGFRAAAIASVFALILAGCGGDEAAMPDGGITGSFDQTSQGVDPTASVPGTPVGGGEVPGVAGEDAANGESEEGINEISSTDAGSGIAVKISARTPKAFTKAHCKQAVMVVIYQPKSIIDEKLLAEARAAAKGVDKLVSLVYKPSDVRKFGDLPTKVGLLSAPGVAIVDRSGAIENFWTTYVDKRLIRASIDNAVSKRPCGASDADMAAETARSPIENAAALVRGEKLPEGAIAPANGAATSAAGGLGSVDSTGVDPAALQAANPVLDPNALANGSSGSSLASVPATDPTIIPGATGAQ